MLLRNIFRTLYRAQLTPVHKSLRAKHERAPGANQKFMSEEEKEFYNKLILPRKEGTPNPEEGFIEFYNRYAEHYDKTMGDELWNPPQKATELFHKQLCGTGVRKDTRILDVASGTGIVGEKLTSLGYTNITGVDLSEGMIKLAEEKGVYKEILKLDLNTTDGYDFIKKHGRFDQIIAVGAFSKHLVQVSAMKMLVPWVIRPNGTFLFTLREPYLLDEKTLFAETISQLEKNGFWRSIHKSVDEYITGVEGKGVFFLFQAK